MMKNNNMTKVVEFMIFKIDEIFVSSSFFHFKSNVKNKVGVVDVANAQGLVMV